jgi:transposase InsO family protein
MGDASIAALTKLVESLITAQARQNEDMQNVVAQLATKESAHASHDEGSFKFELQGITKLKVDGSNYKEWSGAVERMLQGHKSDLWGLVEGTELLHEGATPAEKTKFQKRQFQALNLLLASMGPEKQEQYSLCRDPFVLWETLKVYSASHTVESAVALWRRLLDVQLDPTSMTVESFWWGWEKLFTEARTLPILPPGIDPDAYLVPLALGAMIANLPPTYAPVRDSTLRDIPLPWTAGTPPLVRKLLVEHEIRLKQQEEHLTAFAISTARKPGPSRAGTQGNSRPSGHPLCGCAKSKKKPHRQDQCLSKAFESYAQHFPTRQQKPHFTYFLKKFNAGLSISDIMNTGCKDVEAFNAAAVTLDTVSFSDYIVSPATVESTGTVEVTPRLGGSVRAYLTSPNSSTTNPHSYILDSGATHHMVSDLSLLTSYQTYPTPRRVFGATQHMTGGAHGFGTLTLHLPHGPVSLARVLYVPHLRDQLLSVPRLTQLGFTIVYSPAGCTFQPPQGPPLPTMPLTEQVFRIHFPPPIHASPAALLPRPDLWHLRLGHPSVSTLATLATTHPTLGLPSSSTPSPVCASCLAGKGKRLPFPVSQNRAAAPGDRLHFDLCGPIRPQARGGELYYLVLVDCCTRYGWVYLLKDKATAGPTIRDHVTMLRTQHAIHVKTLRSDGAKEWLSKHMQQFCKAHGITQEVTTPYTSQQNGVAERRIGVLATIARTLLHGGHMPQQWWGHAILWANYLHNLRTVHEGHTLYEAFHHKRPPIQDLHVFGCKVHVLTQAAERSRLKVGKLAPKTRECMYLGHQPGTKAALVWDPQAQRVLTSRDVTCEDTVTFYAAPVPITNPEPLEEEVLFPIPDIPALPAPPSSASFLPPPPTSPTTPPLEDTTTDPESSLEATGATGEQEESILHIPAQATDPPPPPPLAPAPALKGRRGVPLGAEEWGNRVGFRPPSTRTKAPPKALRTVTDHQVVPIPATVHEALEGPDREHWQVALNAEIQSMRDNDVWELVPRPKNTNIVGSKWVLALKVNEKGEVERYKARLVAQGFTQRKGVDYNEVFASVAGKTSTRVIFHIAAQRDMEVDVADVSTAFLNAPLQEGVYMKQPPGFEDSEHPDWVCRLKKSLYGLKQAARCWYKELNAFLTSEGFTAHPLDPCLFTRVDAEGKLIMVLVYVDDLVLAADERRHLDAFKQRLSSRFDIKDLGSIKYYLGIEVEREREHKIMRLHQRGYIQEVLTRFHMENCNPTKTPLDVGHELTVEEHFAPGEEAKMQNVPYAELIGCLMYIMVCTRPDLAYPVSLLARFMADGAYRRKHWGAAKRVLRYLKGTQEWSLILGGSEPLLSIEGDASWGDCKETRRSTQGYVATLGGGPISWKSQRSEAVALSTAEAEYYAAGQAGRKIMFLRNLLEHLGYPQQEPTVLKCDSQSAQAILAGEGVTNRTKHIDIRHHWIREQLVNNTINVEYVASAENKADIMTKALGAERHHQLLHKLGLAPHRAMGGCEKLP